MTTTAARQGPVGARGWMRGIRFSWFSFVMLGLLILAVLILSPTIRVYAAQQQQIAALEKQNASQKAQAASLQKQAQEWTDPEFVKAQARDRLLYVMPGETSYLILGSPAPAASADEPKVSTKVQHAKADWASTLAGSLLAPGVKTAPTKTDAPTVPAKAGSGPAK